MAFRKGHPFSGAGGAVSRSKGLRLGLLFLFLCLLCAGSLVLGDYALSPGAAFEILWGKISGARHGASKMQEVIVWRLRAPRILLAACTGLALAVSGSVYQACFRNPLVEPYTLGVSAGAAAGTALAVLFPAIFAQVQLSAFGLAVLAVFLSYGLAKQRGTTPHVLLVLSGIIVGSLFSALLGVMKYLAADEQLREITFWMMGGFHYANWGDVQMTFFTVLPSTALLCLLGWRLNVLSLGDEEAGSLGVHPERTRVVCVFLATLGAAVCVSAVGIVAWVGLMMPHAARFLLGPDNPWVIPASGLMGAAYLVLCDAVARNLTGTEIPIGIVASVLGSPYLLWLVRTKGRELYGA